VSNSIMLPTTAHRQALRNLDSGDEALATSLLACGKSSRACLLLSHFFFSYGSGLPVAFFIKRSLFVPSLAETAVGLNSRLRRRVSADMASNLRQTTIVASKISI